jgi:hydrogenase small subunit
MALNRRDFLKLMGGTAAAFTFSGVVFQGCKKALKEAAERTNVIWLQGQACSGCSVSLLNGMDPDIASLITQHISLNFHQTLMAGTGSVAVSVLEDAVTKQRKDFVLIVEGSIPTKSDEYCTVGELHGRTVGVRKWVEELGKNAKAIVAVGTCATYGGIPAAKILATGDNPTGAKGTWEFFPREKVINVPGCPPHPDWMMGTLVHFLLKGMPELDEYNRPKMYFGTTVHEKCSRLPDYKRGRFAKHWGEEGCLYLLGCLGMDSGCDIPARKWVDGTESCTGCGSGCIGCTEEVFPDYGTRGLYKHLLAGDEEIRNIEDPQVREAVIKLKNGGMIYG